MSGFCFAFLGNLIFMELGRQDRSTPLIRLAEEGDAPQIAAMYAPVVRDSIISFETEPPSAEEIARHVREDAASEARPSPPVALPSATEAEGWNAALERGLRLPRSGA